MLNQSRGVSTSALIVIVAIVGVLLIAGIAALMLFQANQNTSKKTSEQDLKDSTPATYQSNQDLDSAIKELESLDINEAIDAPLENIDKSAESF